MSKQIKNEYQEAVATWLEPYTESIIRWLDTTNTRGFRVPFYHRQKVNPWIDPMPLSPVLDTIYDIRLFRHQLAIARFNHTARYGINRVYEGLEPLHYRVSAVGQAAFHESGLIIRGNQVRFERSLVPEKCECFSSAYWREMLFLRH